MKNQYFFRNATTTSVRKSEKELQRSSELFFFFTIFHYFSVFFPFFFAVIDRIVLRPHAMSQLDHGTGNLRAKDRRTTHTTGKMTQHSTDTPIRTETMDRHIPAHVNRQAAKLIKRAMHLITHAMN